MQLLSAAFSAVAIAAVLVVVNATDKAIWVRFTVLALWLIAALGILSQRKARQEHGVLPLILIICVFTGALSVVLFGIPHLPQSEYSRHKFVLFLLMYLLVFLVLRLVRTRPTSRSQAHDPGEHPSR